MLQLYIYIHDNFQIYTIDKYHVLIWLWSGNALGIIFRILYAYCKYLRLRGIKTFKQGTLLHSELFIILQKKKQIIFNECYLYYLQ